MDRAGRLPPHRGGRGAVAVPHLTLTFLDSGLALDKTDGESVWFCAWDQRHEMAHLERSVVILVVQRSGRGRHRFVPYERGEIGPLAAHRRCRSRLIEPTVMAVLLLCAVRLTHI